jgi:hypothetical protein
MQQYKILSFGKQYCDIYQQGVDVRELLCHIAATAMNFTKYDISGCI